MLPLSNKRGGSGFLEETYEFHANQLRVLQERGNPPPDALKFHRDEMRGLEDAMRSYKRQRRTESDGRIRQILSNPDLLPAALDPDFKLIDYDDMASFKDFRWKAHSDFSFVAIPMIARIACPEPDELKAEQHLRAWHRFAMKVEVCQLYLYCIYSWKRYTVFSGAGNVYSRLQTYFKKIREYIPPGGSLKAFLKRCHDELPAEFESEFGQQLPINPYFVNAFRELQRDGGIDLGIEQELAPGSDDLYGQQPTRMPPKTRQGTFFDALQGRTPFARFYFEEREDRPEIDPGAILMEYAFSCKAADYALDAGPSTEKEQIFAGRLWAFFRECVAWCVHLEVIYSDWKPENFGIAGLLFPMHLATVVDSRQDAMLDPPELVRNGPPSYSQLLVRKQKGTFEPDNAGDTAMHHVRVQDVTSWLRLTNTAGGVQVERRGRGGGESLGEFEPFPAAVQTDPGEHRRLINQLVFRGASHSSFSILHQKSSGGGEWRGKFIARYLELFYDTQSSTTMGTSAMLTFSHVR